MAKYTNTDYRRIIENAFTTPEATWQVETEDYIDHVYRASSGNMTIRIKELTNSVIGEEPVSIMFSYAYDTGKGYRQPTILLHKSVPIELLSNELTKIVERIQTGDIRETLLEVLEASGYPENQEIVI